MKRSRRASWAGVAAAATIALAGAAGAADIAAQARIYLDAQMLQVPGDVEIAVGELDPRLALAECARIEPFIPPRVRLWGRGHLGVRCVEGAAWTAYVPIHVRVFAQAPVAARAIARGQPLGAEDFRLERVELSQWPIGEIALPDQVEGRVALRALAAAEPIRRGALKLPALIAPGETVRVVFETPAFSVSTDGRALTSAAQGDGVQVTLTTGKTVWGTAAAGKVVYLK